MMFRDAIKYFVIGGLTLGCAAFPVNATPLVVIDARTGDVLLEQEATKPWYPASLTKLITVYVALQAVKQGRLTLDTPLVVSARAARMPPSKMGFKPGQEVTLDNALKMLMVKSANDLAITIAEGVSGSVESFAVQMNRVAAELGMKESHFVNPNGLHDPAHVSSARDMAIVGRALYRDFPDHADLYGIGALRLGNKIIPTHNGIMGRYPGAEGMKTGFVCASGFNVVVSATRGGRRLIAVVLGYPNAKTRTLKAASILDSAFAAGSSGVAISALPAVGGDAPDMRSVICGPHKQEITEDDFAVPVAGAPAPAQSSEGDGPAAFFRNDGKATPAAITGAASATADLLASRPYFEPVPVYVGRAPGWAGAPASATAYAAKPKPNGPLAEDPKAKPLKLVGAKPAAADAKGRKVASREAEPHKVRPGSKAKSVAKAKIEAESKKPEPRPRKLAQTKDKQSKKAN
jgi:D-alanyl-D-alanine carboxypeptidase